MRAKSQRWADDNVEKLKGARPALPDGLNDRAADNWEPLLAIAELAGGDCPMRARAAAIRLSGDREAVAESTGTQLLRAIKIVFETLGVDRITSEELAEELAKDKDSSWAAYGKTGKPITQRQIAALLDRYGVRPDSIRVPGIGTKKGYLFAWLKDAFETYLDAFSNAAPSDPEHRNKPPATGTTNTFSSGIGNDAFRRENDENANNHGPCSGVPDRNSPLSEEHENDPSAPRFERPSPRTVAPDANGSGNGNAPTVRANSLKNNAGTAADGADANPPPQSGPEKTGAPGWSTQL